MQSFMRQAFSCLFNLLQFRTLLDFLRNNIWYNSSMDYEASEQLTDAQFNRLVGVQCTTFEEILAVLKIKHAKDG